MKPAVKIDIFREIFLSYIDTKVKKGTWVPLEVVKSIKNKMKDNFPTLEEALQETQTQVENGGRKKRKALSYDYN